MQHKDGDYFYPLTTIDQVIMEDGITRLNGADLVSVNTDGAPEGETVKVNADTLGGYSADNFIKNTEEIDADTLGGYSADEFAKLSHLENLNTSGISMELLWENASPTSTFAAQTITSDNSEYGYFLVGHKRTVSHDELRWTIVKKNTTTIGYNGDDRFFSRIITATDTEFVFGIGKYMENIGSIRDNGDVVVPTEIYGIKGVSV